MSENKFEEVLKQVKKSESIQDKDLIIQKVDWRAEAEKLFKKDSPKRLNLG